MIGGGTGSFIGPVHRMAAAMDDMIELVSGAFSSNPGTSLKSGHQLGLPDERIYSHWEEMIAAESKLPEDKKPDFICIVTPNFLHYRPALEALKAGFEIVCDKPLTMTVEEALELERIVKKDKRIFCLTHNYTGYPMVKKAREITQNGELGTIRKVVVEYLQGWLSDRVEERGNKQAEWRADPEKAGMAGCMADIGTHAFQLTEYITGKKIIRLFSQLNSLVEGRQLDHDGNVIINLEDGIKGTLIASQVALGEENNLRIRVYGSEGSLLWEQMNPNNLLVRWKEKPYEVYRTATGFDSIGEIAAAHSRIPAGHPEGFIEAFANLYRNFALAVHATRDGKETDPSYDFPGIEDGVRGMKFLEAVVRSSVNDKWVNI